MWSYLSRDLGWQLPSSVTNSNFQEGIDPKSIAPAVHSCFSTQLPHQVQDLSVLWSFIFSGRCRVVLLRLHRDGSWHFDGTFLSQDSKCLAVMGIGAISGLSDFQDDRLGQRHHSPLSSNSAYSRHWPVALWVAILSPDAACSMF